MKYWKRYSNARDSYFLPSQESVVRGFAPSYLTILRHFPKALILGVAATPSQLDEQGFDRFYKSIGSETFCI